MPSMRGMRILVVEDDKLVARAVRRGLEAEGYAVDVALDGTDGAWLAAENEYDALVLDVMLPGIPGDRLCAQLREAGRLDADPDAHRALAPRGGGPGPRRRRGRLSWPSRSPTSSWWPGSGPCCAAAGASARRSWRSATCGLDPAQHQVWRVATPPFDLTPRQFSLLELLMRRPGEVLSKASILEHVWDFAYEATRTSSRSTSASCASASTCRSAGRACRRCAWWGYRLDPEAG